MSQFPLLDRITALPEPADSGRAARGLEQWRERGERSGDSELDDFAKALAAEPKGADLLAALFGNSPFLTQCLLGDLAFARELVSAAPEETLARLVAEVEEDAAARAKAELMTLLRVARKRTALLIAVADIGAIWSLPQVTAGLSDFAAAALRGATLHLLAQRVAAGDIRVPDAARPDAGSGLAVLAMGKLGARELNYSSDIDLVVFYDNEVVDYRGGTSAHDCYVRLTQGLVQILGQHGPDGYVFRTDLRLRPEGGGTPLAMSMIAAENYYESQGQNWERAAMIKARPIAGDIPAGSAFLHRLAPFVWRKYLDFAAIQDIHSIKRQIHDFRGHARIAAAGHNIKLGRGGIREIEFFAQTQQLIAGGRDQRLRKPDTCGAIRALAETGRLDAAVADELVAAYEYLRKLEHRLQMIGDEQTHTVPSSPQELAAIATFMGYRESAEFTDELLGHLGRVQGHYAALFEHAPPLAGAAGSLSFTGTEDDPETLETLTRMGFRQAQSVAASLRRWHHGRYRATRSTRARELLTELTPALLSALAKTANPDVAFARLDAFLANLPAGVQLFSLFYANPSLLDLVAEVMGSAPRLASYLSRNPRLLDGVLTPGFFDPPPPAESLAADLDAALGTAADFEDVLDITRRWAADRKFQVGLQIMRNVTDSNAAGPRLSDIAEVLIRALQPAVEDEFAAKHGRIPEGRMAVLGLGKLGGREMTVGSDLDLIFVFDCPHPEAESDGAKPLALGDYYARLSHRFIAALTALTSEGQVYEVDMRLRPSGKAGPIATGLEAFKLYQAEAAWTWEHMALTRARVISGAAALAAGIEEVVRAVLLRPREPTKLAAEVAEMRQRVDAEHGTADPWAVKHVRGGLVDLEFISQYLQLAHAASRPEVLDRNTSAAFRRLAEAGVLAQQVAEELVEATVLLRNVQGLLRLCSEGPFVEETAPEGLRSALARAGGVADFAALKDKLTETQARVHGHYRALVEAPAAAWSASHGEEAGA